MTGPLRLTTDAGTFDALSAGPTDGRGVLLLHGFPQGAVEWEHQLAALGAAGYHAVAPDQRGYSPGRGPTTSTRTGWTRWSATSSRSPDSSAGRGSTWSGTTGGGDRLGGGRPAPGAAADLHRRVGAAPRPFADALATDADQQRRSAYLAMFRQPGQAEGMLLADDAAFLRRMLGAAGPAKLATYLDRLTAPGALTAALNWYRATRPEDVEAGPVEVPTLYVWGSDDMGVGPVAAHGTGAWVKAPYEFLTFDGVSHWVPEEAPDRLSAALLAHLARHPG